MASSVHPFIRNSIIQGRLLPHSFSLQLELVLLFVCRSQLSANNVKRRLSIMTNMLLTASLLVLLALGAHADLSGAPACPPSSKSVRVMIRSVIDRQYLDG